MWTTYRHFPKIKNWHSLFPMLTQSCLALCDPMDYSLPSSFHGVLQARVLACVAMSFSYIQQYVILYTAVYNTDCMLYIVVFRASVKMYGSWWELRRHLFPQASLAAGCGSVSPSPPAAFGKWNCRTLWQLQLAQVL